MRPWPDGKPHVAPGTAVRLLSCAASQKGCKQGLTWIKSSFLWMMYRCGWATKAGQESVLAIEITPDGFEWALRHACLSSY